MWLEGRTTDQVIYRPFTIGNNNKRQTGSHGKIIRLDD